MEVGGPIVSVLDSRLSCPGFSPGQEHCVTTPVLKGVWMEELGEMISVSRLPSVKYACSLPMSKPIYSMYVPYTKPHISNSTIHKP